MEELRIGKYIIDRYGNTGHITQVGDIIRVEFKDPKVSNCFNTEEEFWGYARTEYYSVGSLVFGNKVFRATIENEISSIRSEIKELNERLDFARKRLWTYDNKMDQSKVAPGAKVRTQRDLEDLTMKFIAECVKELKPFRSPIVEYLHEDSFTTPTTKGAISEDGSHLGINIDMFGERWENKDLYIVICHECRHIWQILSGSIGEYDSSASFSDKREYNEQFAEIDAWAWTCIMCNKRYGVIPNLRRTFGDEYWQKVRSRIEQIG